MAVKISNPVTLTITAADATGKLTASGGATTDVYPGAIGYLFNTSTGASARVTVCSIVDATNWIVRATPSGASDLSHNGTDVSAFAANSTFNCESQPVPVQWDGTKLPAR